MGYLGTKPVFCMIGANQKSSNFAEPAQNCHRSVQNLPLAVKSKPARVYDLDQSVLIGLTGMVFRLPDKV